MEAQRSSVSFLSQPALKWGVGFLFVASQKGRWLNIFPGAPPTWYLGRILDSRRAEALSLLCVKDYLGWPAMKHHCLDELSSFLKDLDQHFCFDSNCLFRALGDQLEGHSRNHLKHRQETVDYMIKQREDFEPFVEDDIPFEKHGRFLVGHWILQE